MKHFSREVRISQCVFRDVAYVDTVFARLHECVCIFHTALRFRFNPIVLCKLSSKSRWPSFYDTHSGNDIICIFTVDTSLPLIWSKSTWTTLFNLSSYDRHFNLNNLLVNFQQTCHVVLNALLQACTLLYITMNEPKQNNTTFLWLTIDKYLDWIEHLMKVLLTIFSELFALRILT